MSESIVVAAIAVTLLFALWPIHAVPRALEVLDRDKGVLLPASAYWWPRMFAAASRGAVIAAPVLVAVTGDMSWVRVCAAGWILSVAMMAASLPSSPSTAIGSS